MVRSLLLSALLIFSSFTSLYAIEITFTAGGTLSGVGPDLQSEFSVGDPFEIILTYDSDTPDSLPEDSEFGIYRNSVLSAAGNIDGYEFTWTPPNPNIVSNTSGINIRVDDVIDIIIRDSLSGPSYFTGAPVNGLTPYFGNFPLFDDDGPGGFLGTQDLPIVVPTIDQFRGGSFKNFRIQWEEGPTQNKIEGDFDYIFAGAPPLEGDFNFDGSVDAADYTIWRDNLGSTTNLDADASGNLLIDAADYAIWVSNYGMSSITATSNAVPEPTSVAVMLISMLAILASNSRTRG